jgi:hypothetical protein
MKLQAVIVLLAIALGVAVPPALPMMAVGGGEAEIGVLDLCHAGAPALSSNGDIPCMNECPCRPLPLSKNRVCAVPTPRCKPFIIAYQDERPPKI